MKQEITRYICDLCGYSEEREYHFKRINFPCVVKRQDKWGYEENFLDYQQIDICSKCENEYRKAIEYGFGVLTVDKIRCNGFGGDLNFELADKDDEE